MQTGPELSIMRYHSACSRFSHVNGTEYVIVAGGNSEVDGTSTEILNVSDTPLAGEAINLKFLPHRNR